MLTQTAAGYSRLCELGPIDIQAVTPDTVKQLFASHVEHSEQTTAQTTFGVAGSWGGKVCFEAGAEELQTGPTESV